MSNEKPKLFLVEGGYYDDIPMESYLSDPCPEPSLSTGVVETLTQRSPAHARAEHPRLGRPNREDSNRADIGSAVHAMLFGGQDVVFAPEEFGDWRTNAAKAFRDEARADGKIALLERQMNTVVKSAEAAREALQRFGPGKPEVTIIGRIGEAWARGRADWLTDDGKYDIDLKTCDSADPYDWATKSVRVGALDVQSGLRSLLHETNGQQREMLWLLQEIEYPYGTSIAGVGATMLDLGRRKCVRAAEIWAKCLKKDYWPGYGTDIMWIDPANFHVWDFEMREATK